MNNSINSGHINTSGGSPYVTNSINGGHITTSGGPYVANSIGSSMIWGGDINITTQEDILEVYIWEDIYEVNIDGDDFDFDELYNINNMSPSDFIKKYQYAIDNRYTTYVSNTMYSEIYRIALKQA